MEKSDKEHLLEYKNYKEVLERSLSVEKGMRERAILKVKLDSVTNCIEMLER